MLAICIAVSVVCKLGCIETFDNTKALQIETVGHLCKLCSHLGHSSNVFHYGINRCSINLCRVIKSSSIPTLVLICFCVSVRNMDDVGSLALILL